VKGSVNLKRWIKLLIVIVIALALFGVYYAKGSKKNDIKNQGEEKGIAFERYNPDDDKDSDIPVLLELGSPTCPACRRMEPVLEEFNNKYGDKVKVKKVNIESPENNDLAQRYKVRLMPTFIFLDKDKKIKGRYEGMLTLEDIEKVFNSMGVVADE